MMNQLFESDTVVMPFTSQTIYGVALSGHIDFHCDTSLVRILIAGNDNSEYVIYESFPMLDTIWDFDFTQQCYETCFLAGLQPTNLFIQISNSTLSINYLSVNTNFVENAATLQLLSKSEADDERITRLNAFINSKKMLWLAGNTILSQSFYKDRKHILDSRANLNGIEYYAGGIFSIFGVTSIWEYPDYDMVENFDWRNRHNADCPGTPYYDNDPLGSGWMTSIKCQDGCWNTSLNIWECITPEQCTTNTNNLWRTTLTCMNFATLGVLEGVSNLYFNRHFDFDLSEQQLMSTDDPNASFPCCGNYNGSINPLNFIIANGVVDEFCFPFQGINVSCSEICNEPDLIVLPDSFQEVYSQSTEPADIMKALMDHGPLYWVRIYPYAVNHAATLVGYDVVKVGDFLFFDSQHQAVIVTPDSDHIGKMYWIFKNSYGNQAGTNGYCNFMLSSPPETVINLTLPIITSNYNEDDILCNDNDNDGYCNWGISDAKPLSCTDCLDEKDGDDSKQFFGPNG